MTLVDSTAMEGSEGMSEPRGREWPIERSRGGFTRAQVAAIVEAVEGVRRVEVGDMRKPWFPIVVTPEPGVDLEYLRRCIQSDLNQQAPADDKWELRLADAEPTVRDADVIAQVVETRRLYDADKISTHTAWARVMAALDGRRWE